MPENEMYVKVLEVVKENSTICKDYLSEAENFLTELASETGGEFPYMKDLQDAQKSIDNVLQQLEIDLKAMGAMITEETSPELPSETESM